jgi:hypothetical protein
MPIPPKVRRKAYALRYKNLGNVEIADLGIAYCAAEMAL